MLKKILALKEFLNLYLYLLSCLKKSVTKHRFFNHIYLKNILNEWLNTFFNLCSRVVNLQRLFCTLKTGVKCLYERFLVYDYICIVYQ